MSFEVKPHGRIGPALQRIAVAEIEKAISHLESFSESTAICATHEARKHFKKVRAIVRLVRVPLGSLHRTEDACFRDVGRQIGALRDAQVLLGALDTLRVRFFEKSHPALLTHARKLLAAREQRCVERLSKEATVAEVVTELRTAVERCGRWDLAEFGWKETCRAMKRSYKRARVAGQAAASDPSVKRLHAWRKRVKDHWYHVRLLRRTCPLFLDEIAHDLEILSEFLGDDHDLAVLRETLCDRRKVLGRTRQFTGFLEMLDIRRRELIDAALDLGSRLYVEAPSDFARELDEKRDVRRGARRKVEKLAPRLL